MEKLVSQQRLRARLSYDPDTGVFTRLSAHRGGAKAGSIFGTINGRGYLVGMIDYRIYLLHRLAWFWVTGEWPEQIDHINGIKNDNRFVNLRPATQQQNEANKRISRRNTSGFKGVSFDRGRWRAAIKAKGKSYNLGYFTTPEEASEAYMAAARKYFGDYATAK